MTVHSIYLEITNQCNLNCRTCYNRSGINRERKEISPKQTEQIIQTFLPDGLQRVLFSGGEPTLHTQFEQILRLIDRYPALSFGLVTNGTVHSPALIEAINTRKNFWIQISLDGSTEEVNAKTRGMGNFAKTLDFIRQLKTPATPPLMKCVLSQQNLDDLEAYYDLACSLNCIPEFAAIYRSGNGASNWEQKVLSPQQRIGILSRIKTLNQTYGISAFLPHCTGTCPFSTETLKLSLCVRTDGAVQPCQMLYGDKFTLTNMFCFDRKEFQENLDRICRIAVARKQKDYGCYSCPLRGFCGKGCMAMAEDLEGDPTGCDGDCDLRRLQLFSFHRKEALKLR